MESATLFSLPDEIIVLVLKNASISDINNFISAFPKYNDLVIRSHGLWKLKFKSLVNYHYFKAVEKHTCGNWHKEVVDHFEMHDEILKILAEMASQYYSCVSEISFLEMKPIFALAHAKPTNYCRVIFILQDHIKISYHYLNNNMAHKPYTLTEVYYAKLSLRYLFHTYLAMKWAHGFMLSRLDPVYVLNYFVQWVDPINMHFDEDVDESMFKFYELVRKEIIKTCPTRTTVNPKTKETEYTAIKQEDIVRTISNVIYKQKQVVLMPNINLETLDIVQALRKKCGNLFSIGAIFHSTAQQFGATCNLIAFPNHFFLEWHNIDIPYPNLYKIALDNGTIRPKGVCPFSNSAGIPTNTQYCPLSMLQYLAMDYISSMGEVQNWYTRNAELVFKFINSDVRNNPYVKYLSLFSIDDTPDYYNKDIEFTNFGPEHLKALISLSDIGKSKPPIRRNASVRNRSSGLKFAVGMICYHTEFNYVCLIRGWEDSANPRRTPGDTGNLKFGPKQPFYVVLAMDQSERYVPQEYIQEYAQPTRLYHLEDTIAKEFTYFNGYAYEPNDMKMAEYPDDFAVLNLYKSRYEMRTSSETI